MKVLRETQYNSHFLGPVVAVTKWLNHSITTYTELTSVLFLTQMRNPVTSPTACKQPLGEPRQFFRPSQRRFGANSSQTTLRVSASNSFDIPVSNPVVWGALCLCAN